MDSAIAPLLALARQIAGSCYGPDIAVERLAGSQHPVFRIRAGDADKILKLAASRDSAGIAKELMLIELVGRCGVPAPRVEHADPSGDRFGWPAIAMASAGRRTVFDCIRQPGQTKYELFTEMGAIQARIHQIGFPGGGEIHADGIRPDAPRQYWDALCQWAGQLAAQQLLAESEADFFRSLPRPDAEGRQLCHSDFHAVQCIEDQGKITAVVDWESAWSGNPLIDLAITHAYLDFYAPPELVKRFFAGYTFAQPLPPGYERDYLPVRIAQTLGVLRAWHGRGPQAWQTVIKHGRVARVVELFRNYQRAYGGN